VANIMGLQFTVTFDDLPAGTFAVVDFELREALNAPFSLSINLASQGLAHGVFVRRFRYAEAVSTAGVELKDYSFTTPACGLSHRKMSNALEHQREQYEHYDSPAALKAIRAAKPSAATAPTPCGTNPLLARGSPTARACGSATASRWTFSDALCVARAQNPHHAAYRYP